MTTFEIERTNLNFWECLKIIKNAVLKIKNILLENFSTAFQNPLHTKTCLNSNDQSKNVDSILDSEELSLEAFPHNQLDGLIKNKFKRLNSIIQTQKISISRIYLDIINVV